MATTVCPQVEPTMPGPTLTSEEAFLECSSRWYNTLRKYSFATEGLGLFIVAVVGVLANMLSIAVLCQRTMKSQITALLITLAIFDILFLLCTMPVFTAQSVNGFVEYLNECLYASDANQVEFMSARMMDIYSLCLPFLYGMTHVSKVGSVFSTLAVSLERYFAVCRPLWIRIRRCHPATYIVIVLVFAFGFNIPKFLEFEAVTNEENRTVLQPSALRTSEHYVVYYNFVTKTLLTELFPYVSLMFLNACIYREIRRSVKIQQAMRCTQSQKEEIKSANVVVGIVFLSILCHIWKIVPDLYEAIMKIQGSEPQPKNVTEPTTGVNDPWNNCTRSNQTEEETPILEIEMIIDTSHLLVGVNSAANFFLYYLLRKNFRSATWRLLTCKKAPPPANPGMTRVVAGPANSTTTSFINRCNDSTRVHRRATVAVSRMDKNGDQMQSRGHRTVSYNPTNSAKGARFLTPESTSSRYLASMAEVPNGHCRRINSDSHTDIQVFIEEDGSIITSSSMGRPTLLHSNRNLNQHDQLSLKRKQSPCDHLSTSLADSIVNHNGQDERIHLNKKRVKRTRGERKNDSKVKKKIVEEISSPSEDEIPIVRNSVRILEQKYIPPYSIAMESDSEMATVLITFPEH